MKIKKIKRSFIACTLALSVMLSNSALAAMNLVYDGKTHNYKADPIVLSVNEKIIETVIPPVIMESRTLVPARAVFEELGASVLWVEETKQIFVTMDQDIVVLKINDKVANVNGKDVIMEIAPKIISKVNENGSTMIPVRFVAESLNFKVGWDGNKRIVSVDKAEEIVVPPVTEIPTPVTPVPPVIIPTPEPVPEVIIPTPEPTPGVVELKGDGTIQYNNVTYPAPQSGNYSLVNITSVTNSGENFKIKASAAISSVDYGIIQDPIRFYVDINNSTSKLQTNIAVSGSNTVTGVRTAQKGDATNVTRVVFDLSKGQDYNIYLSEDRTTLNVDFKPVIIEKVTFENLNGIDAINIYSSAVVTPSISELTNPYRIVIDIPSSFSTIGNIGANISGSTITSIRTSQYDANTVRLVLDAAKLTNYDISYNNSCTTIKLVPPTYSNINYETYSAPRLVLKKSANNYIDINSIIHQDKYLEGYYKLTLPGDYASTYGYGTYKINDTYLNDIKIQTSNGKTEFVFGQKNIYAYTIQEDTDNIYINILNPKSVYKQIIVIDAGHGGTDPGTTKNVFNGMQEKAINLAVSNKLYALLEADPYIKVYVTRAGDTYPTLTDRVVMANHAADMFVSMHCNSIDNKDVSGVQVYYSNPADTRGAISQQISKIIMSKVTSLSGIPQRGANQVAGYSFKVLKDTKIPAVLVEMGFVTNLYDATKLSNANTQQAIAQGLYESIKEAFATIIPKR